MPEASRRVLRKGKARPANSPAARDPNIPRAPHPAVSPDQAGPVVQVVVPASVLVPGLAAALRVQADSAAHAPDSAALPAPRRLRAKHRAHNAPAMPVAAAVASNIPRRRKAR